MIYIYIYIYIYISHENLTYLEYDDWGSPRKNKFICLLTSPLFHALQHEIINLIYLYICIKLYVYIRVYIYVLYIYIYSCSSA